MRISPRVSRFLPAFRLRRRASSLPPRRRSCRPPGVSRLPTALAGETRTLAEAFGSPELAALGAARARRQCGPRRRHRPDRAGAGAACASPGPRACRPSPPRLGTRATATDDNGSSPFDFSVGIAGLDLSLRYRPVRPPGRRPPIGARADRGLRVRPRRGRAVDRGGAGPRLRPACRASPPDRPARPQHRQRPRARADHRRPPPPRRRDPGRYRPPGDRGPPARGRAHPPGRGARPHPQRARPPGRRGSARLRRARNRLRQRRRPRHRAGPAGAAAGPPSRRPRRRSADRRRLRRHRPRPRRLPAAAAARARARSARRRRWAARSALTASIGADLLAPIFNRGRLRGELDFAGGVQHESVELIARRCCTRWAKPRTRSPVEQSRAAPL